MGAFQVALTSRLRWAGACSNVQGFGFRVSGSFLAEFTPSLHRAGLCSTVHVFGFRGSGFFLAAFTPRLRGRDLGHPLRKHRHHVCLIVHSEPCFRFGFRICSGLNTADCIGNARVTHVWIMHRTLRKENRRNKGLFLRSCGYSTRFHMKRELRKNVSCGEVYYTACSLPVI